MNLTPEDLVKWATALQTAGPWGLLLVVSIISALVCRSLFKKYEDSQQSQIDHGKIYAGALQDSAKATEKQNEIIVDLSARVAELNIKVDLLRPERSRR